MVEVVSTVENLDGFCSQLRAAVKQHRNIIPLWGAGGAFGVGMWDPTGSCWALLYPTHPMDTLRLVKLKLFPNSAFSPAIPVKES